MAATETKPTVNQEIVDLKDQIKKLTEQVAAISTQRPPAVRHSASGLSNILCYQPGHIRWFCPQVPRMGIGPCFLCGVKLISVLCHVGETTRGCVRGVTHIPSSSKLQKSPVVVAAIRCNIKRKARSHKNYMDRHDC